MTGGDVLGGNVLGGISGGKSPGGTGGGEMPGGGGSPDTFDPKNCHRVD